MKTMKIEKHLLFTDVIRNLDALEVSDAITYEHEMEGIRAIGELLLSGSYTNQDGSKESFHENLELDVLAPNAKLTNEPFYLKVENYEGKIEQEGICVYITMSIHGIGDQVNTTPQEISIPILPTPIMNPIEHEEMITESKEVVDTSQNEDEMEEFEDLFEDADTTYTSYRMVVARGNDTYDTIAQRYDVKEDELRHVNHDKEVHEKTLVILPATIS